MYNKVKKKLEKNPHIKGNSEEKHEMSKVCMSDV